MLHLSESGRGKSAAAAALFASLLGLSLAPRASLAEIDCYGVETAKLLASDGMHWDYFGYGVAIEHDTAVIAATTNDNGEQSGSLYVFVRKGGNWIEYAELHASDGDPGDLFGQSIAMSGDTLVVGAAPDDECGENAGAAYVFTRTGNRWYETAKLCASDPLPGQLFGGCVAIDGDTLIVTAPFQFSGLAGAAYVFERDAGGCWVETTKLVPSAGMPDDNFGGGVALCGNVAAIAASRHYDGDQNIEAIYLFERRGRIWVESAILNSGSVDGLTAFGAPEMIPGMVVVGAALDNEIAPSAGAVYVFEQTGDRWERTKLFANDGADNDWFGWSVALAENTILVGSFQDDDLGSRSGSVYVFTRRENGWVQTAKLLPSDGESQDVFGHVVALSNGTAIIGARGDQDNGDDSGAAYVFDITCGPAGDLDYDGDVDFDDFTSLLARWGACPPIGDCLADLDGDAEVDFDDLTILLAHWS